MGGSQPGRGAGVAEQQRRSRGGGARCRVPPTGSPARGASGQAGTPGARTPRHGENARRGPPSSSREWRGRLRAVLGPPFWRAMVTRDVEEDFQQRLYPSGHLLPSDLTSPSPVRVLWVNSNTTQPVADQNGSETFPFSTVQAAGDALPEEGGTLWLVPGDYAAEA